jgi:hypothetical protein
MDIEPSAQAACEYTELGYRVLPVHGITAGGKCTCQGRAEKCFRGKPGKHPRILDWSNRATSSTRTILEWWTRFPGSNIALLTGDDPGVLVADFDGGDGRALAESHGLLADDSVPMQTTGGGVQAFHRPPTRGIRSAVALLPGFDIRAGGGYAIVAPSKHAGGKTYAWRTPLPDVSGLPATYPWYPISIDRRRRANPKPQVGDRSRARDLLGYACDQLAAQREENHTRNTFLYGRAYHFAGYVVAGYLDETTFRTWLYDAAIHCGLEPSEIDATLDSPFQKGTPYMTSYRYVSVLSQTCGFCSCSCLCSCSCSCSCGFSRTGTSTRTGTGTGAGR